MSYRALCLLVLCGCAEDEFDVLVTVQDPLGIATSATTLHVGASLDALAVRVLAGLEFVDQLSVTIGVNNRGDEQTRWFWAEARDANDLVLARGATEIDFDGDDRASLDLRAICDARALCPSPVETYVCCVGSNVCVGRAESCPPDSTPTLVGFGLEFLPDDSATASNFNVSPSGTGDDGITLEARVYISAPCTTPGGCQAWLINKPGQWNLRLEAEQDRPYMLTSRIDNQSGGSRSVETAAILTADTSYHTAVTYDGTTVQVYVDGVPLGSGGMSGRLDTSSDTVSTFAPTSRFILDELRVWSRARTEQQLQSFRDETLTGTESDLVAHWSFDEGEGQIAHSSVNGHDMTLGTAPGADDGDPTWTRWQP